MPQRAGIKPTEQTARGGLLACGLIYLAVLVVAALAGGGLQSAAAADCSDTPITQWPTSAGGNDHFYQGVCAPGYITWDAAKLAAEAAGGHLVTQTSAAENNFVFGLIDSPGFWTALGSCSIGPWIGLSQPVGSPEPAGGWRWVTGEPFVFSNWAANEPNNQGGNEDVALFWSDGGCPGAEARSAKWNDGTRDHGGLGGGVGYVIEWEVNPHPPGIHIVPAGVKGFFKDFFSPEDFERLLVALKSAVDTVRCGIGVLIIIAPIPRTGLPGPTPPWMAEACAGSFNTILGIIGSYINPPPVE